MRPRLINRVSEAEAAGQIGAKKVELLRMFRKWLYDIAEHEEMEFRAAPSVIARSEAEMFGLSSPRFAFRTDFADNGFVNARRLERTAANLNDDAIAHVLKSRSQSCVADCLLAPPLRLAEYRMVQVELGRACGEGKPIVGVPYLKHMLFGGGMCCQAAAYMVLALLDRAGLPRLIPGVADLSAIANRANDEVNIDGLTVGAALRLFRSDEIGLSASWEMTPQDDETHLNHLTTALRAYVCSGFPPILLVDLGLLLATTHEGKTLLDANDYPKKAQGTEVGPATAPSTPDACDDVLSERHRPHAIVVYGCHPERDRFVVGDPATAPFLEADVRALAAIRKKSSATVTASPQRAHEGVQYIAATPKGVELPLLCDLGRFAPASSSNENSLFPGLIHLANQWLRAGPAPGSPKFPGMPRYRDTPGSLGSFRLLRLTDDVETATMLDPEWLSDRARIAVRADLSLWLKPGWYWVQRVEAPDDSNQWEETLWIWDASLQPRPLERDAGPERYFVAVYGLKKGIWMAIRGSDVQNQRMRDAVRTTEFSVYTASPRPENEDRKAKSLRPSIVTSFATSGSVVARRLAPDLFADRNLPCEVYCFMEPEVDSWRQRPGRPNVPGRTAAAFAAHLDEPRIKSIASRLTKRHRNIVGIASFIPEIGRSKNDDSATRDVGIRAVTNLLKLAHQIDALSIRETPRFVEIVAGSLFRSVRKEERTTHPTSGYFVGLHKPESLRRDLLEALEKVVSDTPRIRTPLAIECEPGQYFLVQDWTSLKDIAYELDANKTLRSRVGINLDVSHFKLAGIDPTWIRHDQKVRDRIVHAHLSGSHRCSHFGDLPPLGLMDEAESQADFVRREYEPWIDLLRTIAGDVRDNGLPFSGHVSLELEAAKCVGDVRNGLEQLIDLL